MYSLISANLMRTAPLISAIIAVLLITGCVSQPPVVEERSYREIPAGYLQPCELPPTPLSTGELSEAFVVAFKCAEQGNRDKERIRNLTQQSTQD